MTTSTKSNLVQGSHSEQRAPGGHGANAEDVGEGLAEVGECLACTEVVPCGDSGAKEQHRNVFA